MDRALPSGAGIGAAILRSAAQIGVALLDGAVGIAHAARLGVGEGHGLVFAFVVVLWRVEVVDAAGESRGCDQRETSGENKILHGVLLSYILCLCIGQVVLRRVSCKPLKELYISDYSLCVLIF